MKKSQKVAEHKSWMARLKLAVAGLALAGALAGGAAVVTNDAPVQNDEDTTEVAMSYRSYRSFARSSWH